MFDHRPPSFSILAGLDRLAAGPWSGWLGRGTDFFWSYENGKRLPLRLVAGDLVHSATGVKVARFTAPDTIERLVNRSLIPNLLLMFLVSSILPGVRAWRQLPAALLSVDALCSLSSARGCGHRWGSSPRARTR